MIRLSRVFFLLFSFVLVGCGARQQGAASRVPSPPREPFAWLPADASVIGRADLDRLRKTPFWPLWTKLEAQSHVATWVDLAEVSTVTFGGTGDDPEHASYIAALTGRFREDTLRALAARDGVTGEQRGLLTIYKRPDAVWAQVDEHLIVTATNDRLDALVSRASAGADTPVKGAALYQALAERVSLSHSHLAVIVDDQAGTRRASVEHDARRLGLGTIARDAKRLGFGLETGGTYHLVAVAEAESAARAEALSTDVRSKLDAVTSNFLVRMLGVSALLEALKTGQDGNFVQVRGDIDEGALNDLVARLEGAGLRMGARESSGQP